MSAAVITPEITSRVELAQTLALAARDVTIAQQRLRAAQDLVMAPAHRATYIAGLNSELKTAEATYAAASRAVTEANRRDEEARARARADDIRQQLSEAKTIVATMTPLVLQLNALNEQLEALRTRLDYRSDVPPAFRPHLLTVERWLQHAKRFVGDVR